MARCAVVDVNTNIVTNLIVAEPTDVPPSNSIIVEIKKLPIDLEKFPGIDINHPLLKDGIDQVVHIGWKWTGTEFVEIK